MVENNNKEKEQNHFDEGDSSLGRRALQGGIWVFVLKASHRTLGLIRTIILARLLAPSDFGLFGIAVLAINMMETFSDIGIGQALIQKRGDIKNYLDTAWTVQVLRSITIFALLYLAAPSVSRFFQSPQALNIIRAVAFIELFTGFGNIGTVYFQKELRFDKRFTLGVTSLVANISISLTLAFLLKSVWALVYGSLAGAFVTMVMSYVLQPYRPKLRLDLIKLKELLNFGKWLFGSSILVFLVTQGDDAFVGKILGVTTLGFYQMAYRLSNAPATEITNVISMVTFPAYSKMQENISRIRDAYLNVLQVTLFLSIPMAGLIFVLAPDFTRIFLGDKWMPMVPAMQVLAIAGLLLSIEATMAPIFLATGRPRIGTFWQSIRLIVLVLCIYPLSMQWGIAGTSLAVCMSIAVCTFGSLLKVSSIIKMKAAAVGKIMIYPIANTCLMLLGVLFLRWNIRSIGIFSFLAMLFTGGIVYFITNYLCNKFTGFKIYDTLKEKVWYNLKSEPASTDTSK